jgi:hypothetical protein
MAGGEDGSSHQPLPDPVKLELNRVHRDTVAAMFYLFFLRCPITTLGAVNVSTKRTTTAPLAKLERSASEHYSNTVHQCFTLFHKKI